MAELFEFRCPQCSKRLGVSPKKTGKPVQCPRCGTELIVPSPVEDVSTKESPDEFEGLGIDLGLTSTLDLRPVTRTNTRSDERAVDEVEAIAFLVQNAATDEVDPSTLRDSDDSERPSSDVDDPDLDFDPEPLVRTPIEPLIPQARRSKGFEKSIDRRRDVVIPRTAVVAWSLFALLALAFSFIAGLMIGHYRWK